MYIVITGVITLMWKLCLVRLDDVHCDYGSNYTDVETMSREIGRCTLTLRE